MKDFKDIEQSGITLETGQVVKGVVFAFAGDILWSHLPGGFKENFSKSINFFRYCFITRDRFANEPIKPGPARTVETTGAV